MIRFDQPESKKKSASRGADDESAPVWSFDHRGRWAKTDAALPLLHGTAEEVSQQIEDAGYCPFLSLGQRFATLGLEVFKSEDAGYWVQLCLADDLTDVVCADVPALLIFLATIAPLVRVMQELES